MYNNTPSSTSCLWTLQEIGLRAVEPFYPDGMMHYYVDYVEPDSVASRPPFFQHFAFEVLALKPKP